MSARSAADDGGKGSASRPHSRRWFWLGALALALIVAAIGVGQVLQPERMGAIALAQAERALGLRIVTGQPATLALWPGLRLRLNSVQLRDPLNDALIGSAERVDLALPLRVLWTGTGEADQSGAEQTGLGRMSSGQIELMAPAVLLPALQAWLARAADEGPPAPLRVPAFASTIGVSQGRLQADDWELRDLELELSAIREGETARASLTFEILKHGAAALPLALEMAATANQSAAGIRLEVERLALQVAPESAGTALTLTAAGTVQLEPPQLLVEMRVESAGIAALLEKRLPPETFDALRVVAEQPLQLGYRGSFDLDGQATLDSLDAAHPLHASANLAELIRWADAAENVAESGASPLPPVALQVEVLSLPVAGLTVQGLTIEMTAEAPDHEGSAVEPAGLKADSGRTPLP